MEQASDGMVPAPADPQGGIPLRSWLTVLTATLATITYSFTWNSVTVALPHMQGTFSATTDQITWVMVAFVVGSAMMTACTGWLTSRFGRRSVFRAALLAYVATLLGCGFATSLESMVVWRFLQGLAGAPLIPLGQVIAVSALPPSRYSQATSLWALGFVAGNVLAPPLAGHLVENQGWPYIFFMTVPVGIAVLMAATFLVPETEKEHRPMDWLGCLTLIIGLGLLQLMLARGERLDWLESGEIVLEAAAAALLLYIFIAHTLTAREPFIDPRIFLNRNYAIGLVCAVVIGAVLYLPLLLMPLILQGIAAYPADQTGNLMISRGVGTIGGLLLMSQVRDRIDPRIVFSCGVVFTVIPAWFMSQWTTEVRAWDVFWTNGLQGLATSAIWQPLNMLGLRRLEKRHQDTGFALFYLSFDMGSAFGTAGIISLHARNAQASHAALSEAVNPYAVGLGLPSVAGGWSVDSLAGLAALDSEIGRQAAMIAFNNAFLLITAVLALLGPMVFLFRTRR